MKNLNAVNSIAPVDTSVESAAVELLKNEKGSALPYIVAWLLGVPTSLLILIALVRAVF